MLYVDAFAGAGVAEDRETGERLRGSAIRLLEVEPQFHELHFVEQNENKAAVLEQITSFDGRVRVHRGDANEVLTRDVLPSAQRAAREPHRRHGANSGVQHYPTTPDPDEKPVVSRGTHNRTGIGQSTSEPASRASHGNRCNPKRVEPVVARARI
jgi:hypothetical protein